MQSKECSCNLLNEENISSSSKLMIDPDNVFWALLPNKKSADDHDVLKLHSKLKSKLDDSMDNFRFSVALNSVYINLTDRCNADCPYCYVPAKQRKSGKQMSDKEHFYVLKKIERYFDRSRPKNSSLKPVIIYHGSEPLLVKEMIFSAIEKYKAKFHFGIQTNAILLTAQDVAFLKKRKVSVGISLDSLDSKVNDHTRRSKSGSNYEKALKAIEWFDGYEGLNVITTVTRFNVKGLSDLVYFLHKKKVVCVLLNPVRATRASTVKLRPEIEDLTKYFKKAVDKAISLSKSSGRRIIIGNFSNIMLAIVAPQSRRLMCDISPCGAGRCFLAITAGGDIVPCGEFIALRDFRAGNIFDTSIKQALNSEQFKRVRARKVENIEECDVCNYRNICGAPCAAEVYSLSKDENKMSPYCDFYKEMIPYAFKLIEQEKMQYLFRKDALRDVKYEYNLVS